MIRDTPIDPLLDAAQVELVDALPDAALLVAADGRIVYGNRLAFSLFGADDDLPADPVLTDVIRGSEELIAGLGPASGTERRVHLDPTDDRPGMSLRALGVSHELWLVTADRRPALNPTGRALDRAREELARMRGLVQRQKEHLATVTHEMRTPMGAILGLMEMLARTELDGDQLELVDTVRSSAESMKHLVEGIFDYARVESGAIPVEHDHFSVPDLVESLARSLAIQANRAGLELSMSVDAGLAPLHVGDARLVRQILTNLASNALKFTDQGEVHIRARASAVTGHHDTVTFEVSDTGPGIPESMQGRIFEPFVQAHEDSARRGGSGLGLAVVRGLVDRLGGRIGVDSAPGAGSTFRITLPLVHAQEDCPQRRLSDQAWPDAEVVLVGGSRGVKRGLSSACGHMGTGFRSVTFEELPRTMARTGSTRSVVLLDSTLADDQRRKAWCILGDAQSVGTPVRAVDLLPATALPGDDTERPDFVATLSKPVVRRALAVHLASEGARFSSSGPRPSTRALRVLTIEDDPAIQLFLATVLRRLHGAEVTGAGRGRDGIRLSSDADVILVDESLPDTRGRDVARRIREERGSDVIIVACSGHGEDRFRAELVDGTFDAHLQKPCQGGELIALLEDLLSRERGGMRPAPRTADQRAF